MRPLRATVCELRAEALEDGWAALVRHVREAGSDLVLLPEMGFAAWFAHAEAFDPAQWSAAVAAHERWLERLDELAPAAVLGTRPVNRAGERRNEAFAVAPETGYVAAHDKFHLPDEPDFREASWYGRGDGRFETATVAGAATGFLVCTELWFFDRARAYGEAGAQIVAVPRCTPSETLSKWLAGGRAAAVVAGAYCLSSNHGDERFGGLGWIVDPDGEVLATTSRDEPFVTAELDLDAADAAKATYPRYVPAA